MPLSSAKKIIDEIASDKFSNNHNLKTIEVWENWDALLNKDIIIILRYIRKKLPEIDIELFTNFQNLVHEKTLTILSENLIDYIHCNIDGSNKTNYFSVKRLNLWNTLKNLLTFFKVRDKIKSSVWINIRVTPLHQYIHSIHKEFGFYPRKMKDLELTNIPDDYNIIVKQFYNIADHNKDSIKRQHPFWWAERESINLSLIDYSKYNCPYIERVKREAFIAPDWTWYACCLDSNNELSFGNVIEKSIDKVYNWIKRENFIKKLEKRDYWNINGPCKTINCCQTILMK